MRDGLAALNIPTPGVELDTPPPPGPAPAAAASTSECQHANIVRPVGKYQIILEIGRHNELTLPQIQKKSFKNIPKFIFDNPSIITSVEPTFIPNFSLKQSNFLYFLFFSGTSLILVADLLLQWARNDPLDKGDGNGCSRR